MHLAINATPAAKGQKTGVEYYTHALISHLRSVAPEVQVALFSHKELDIDLPSSWRNYVLRWSFPGWSALRWSAELALTRPELIFVPGNAMPMVIPKHSVTTIHDLAFAHSPELYTLKEQKRLDSAHERAAKLASHIIAISEVTKNDIIERYNVPSEKITIVPLGIDHDRFYERSADDEDVIGVKSKYNLDRPYLLFVGRIEKKKGIDTLLNAFRLAQAKFDRPVDLVLAGMRGSLLPEGFDELLASTMNVRELGYVPDKDIGPLMSGAEKFVFPTRKEGFGIPILEAMACGKQVICSDIPVLREVGGNIPAYVPVNDVSAWERTLIDLIPSARDNVTIARGVMHSQQYTWDAAAKKTWSVLSRFIYAD
jgi:glycosyltransferase involved in cell wall biosynthesis